MHFVHKVVKRSIFDVLMLQVIELFDGAVFSGSSAWKPVQTGIKLSTTSVLRIFTTLVASGDNRFLLTSRLNQDALENVFSQVRGKGDAHPSIVAFRHNMRSICLSQFMTVPKTAAYHPDTTPHLLELVHQRGQNLHEVNEIDENCFGHFSKCNWHWLCWPKHCVVHCWLAGVQAESCSEELCHLL